ncbi:MAG: hypothetical protein J7K29_02690 [Candidatus Cloacimonetes bacterium]|nr:hypothetical protein [Candidatus Cloacimonadota bacterium]
MIKGKRRILIFNSILFAILFLSISLNKEILRPLYRNVPLVGVVTGCFPNFIAAFIISLCFMNGIVIRRTKHERLIVYISSILIFVILTIEELKPMWGASTHYDLFDIIASGIGSLLAITIFEIIVSRQKN